MSFTLSQIEHVMHTLSDVNSADVSFLNSSIQNICYDYRRSLISVSLFSDSSEKGASVEAATKRRSVRGAFKNQEKALLADGCHKHVA